MLAYLLAVLESIMTPALADPALARAAAQQAFDAYQPRTVQELIATGQILSFALSSMENLRLAATETVSPSMQLKLRGNANGLNRSSRHASETLHAIRRTAPHSDRQTPKAEPAPAKANWAAAMTSVAAKLSAAQPPSTPAQRQVNALWIGALTNVAAETRRCESVTPPRQPTLKPPSGSPRL